MAIRVDHVGFLTPGNYAAGDPAAGLEDTLALFEFGESLGFDGAWVRQRHLEPGVSSAAVFLAAATQRTRRIELGSAVIQMGYENPFRLAEDLATVDVLSHGRLQVGISAGPPPHADLVAPLAFDDWQGFDFSHQRVARLADNLRGGLLGDAERHVESAAGRFRPELHPRAPGLAQRLWYGGGSLRSAGWAGDNGFNLMVGNVTTAEDSDDFLTAQLRQLDLYDRSLGLGDRHVAVGRVILPLDGADGTTREKYRAFAAGRHQRTLAPQGPRRTMFLPDLVGSATEILNRLADDPVLPRVRRLRLELPYNFTLAEYRQILSDFITLIAPGLGWTGRSSKE